MKKVILSCLLIAGFCASVFCAAKRPQLEPIESEIYSFKDGDIEYTNLPQYEMLAIACRIAGVPGFTGNYNGGYAYLDQIDSMAPKYKDHKLVKAIKSASKRGVTCDGFINLAYHIKSDFSSTTCDLDPKPDSLNWELKKLSGMEIYNIVKHLHEFAKETQFMRFREIYRADYIKVTQSTNDWMNKYKVQNWFQEFYGTVMPVTINFSYINVGNTFYDFTTGSDGKEKYFVTGYPYVEMQYIIQTYIMCYAQKYANSAWDTVKDVYKNYIMAYQKRVNPDNYDSKNFDSLSSYNLALLISPYCLLEFIGYAFEEEAPGIYEESKNAFYKTIQDENFAKVFDLIDEYQANRDKYPALQDFYPRITELIMNLPVE